MAKFEEHGSALTQEPVASTSRVFSNAFNAPASLSPPHSGSNGSSSPWKGKGRADGFVKAESSASPAASHEEGERKKRKKASRACAACQRAHLTCDDGRPCERCIKRGCADTCQDGKRKKAKYLRDIEDELVEMRHNPPAIPSSRNKTTAVVGVKAVEAVPIEPLEEPVADSALYDTLLPSPAPAMNETLTPGLDGGLSSLDDPTFFASDANFGSEGANLEYSILSSMLSNTGYVEPTLEEREMLDPDLPSLAAMQSRSYGSQNGQTPPAGPVSAIRQDYFGKTNGHSSPLAKSAASPASSSNAGQMQRADEVYTSVTAPYPYASSYHDLIRHLKEKFDRADIVRVIRALALFRPSLIALQMPLSEEDEIFIEKCFQRTLIEYEKLIGLSGTPTVVWRRTCEICLVGPEFCMLTKWKREDLVGRKRYIFELFDNASVVGYFEQVAAHAFENTTSTVMTTCNLLTPTGEAVPCSFCFSIKRDLFSIPSLIIGQFLPILDEKPSA